jgi:DNA-binding MarR family transcriptional regulator
MDEVKVLSTIEEIQAFSDIFRFKIVNAFYNLGKPSTVKQIADSIKETPAKVHYHVKKLEKVDLLRLVYTQEVNGIIAKFYEPTAKSFIIEHKDELSEVQESLIKSETERMISTIYKNSRDTFIRQKWKSAQNKEKNTSRISSGDIYLTKDEMESFTKYVLDFFTSHESIGDNSGKEKYHCFFSIVKNEVSEDEEVK